MVKMKKNHPKSIPRKPASESPQRDRKKHSSEDFNHDLRGTISELEAKLNRFQNLVENVDDVLVEIDSIGRVLYVTANVETFSGYKPEELIGKVPTEFMPPELAEEIYRYFLELTSRGEKIEAMELTGIHKDGHHFIMEAYAVPYFDTKGQILGYRGVARGITDRKLMQERLRESQQDLSHAQEVAHTGSWRLDLHVNELRWSDETYRIFNIPRGTSMNYEAFLSTIHPEDREYVDRKWKAALRGETYDVEHRIITSDTVKWVRERAELEFDNQGNLLGGFGTVQDITDRKQMEEALRESEERFRSAFEGAVPMTMTALDGRLILVNAAYSKMLGYSESELAGMSFYDITHPDDIPANKVGIDAVVSGEKDSFRMEKRYIRKDGQIIWVDMSTSSVRDSGGKPLYIVTHAQDITERKRAEEVLQKSRDELEDKVRERTAQLSEINKSLLAEIQERKRTEKRLRAAQKNLRAMASEIVIADEKSRQNFATELHDSVVQTLGAAKLRSELMHEIIPEECHSYLTELHNLILQSIAQARSIMSEMSPPVLYELGFVTAIEWLSEQIQSQHNLEISCQANDNFKPLSHEVQIVLFQATRELLLNVVKHAKAKKVVVSITEDQKKAQITIIDDGIGFDGKISFQADASGGFGLFSIRERLKHLGGQLSIFSKPGKGTRMIMTAPRNL
jgi:PAS domain S-box-containing protein